MSFLVIREFFYCLNMLLPFLKLSSVVIKSYFINYILQIHTLFLISNIKSPSEIPRAGRGLSPSFLLIDQILEKSNHLEHSYGFCLMF